MVTTQTTIDKIENLTDENLGYDIMVNLINQSISHINLKLRTFFPLMDKTLEGKDTRYTITGATEEEIQVDEALKYQVDAWDALFIDNLVVRYASYLVMINDDEEERANQQIADFLANLNDFSGMFHNFTSSKYITRDMRTDFDTSENINDRRNSYDYGDEINSLDKGYGFFEGE